MFYGESPLANVQKISSFSSLVLSCLRGRLALRARRCASSSVEFLASRINAIEGALRHDIARSIYLARINVEIR